LRMPLGATRGAASDAMEVFVLGVAVPRGGGGGSGAAGRGHRCGGE